ncbi:MAG: hypothetical protein E7328_04635 [Clostridiales bacterium]|nr:hypothetical protein [Clostridiales bacterium]
MRIFISLDMEGSTGLCSFREVDPASPFYSRGTRAMEEDLRAVLQGAREAGATEFYICDAHDHGANLSLDSLGEDVFTIRGTGHPLSMMAGVDLTEFDGAFFLGYHAKRGSSGVMAHTYYLNVVQAAYVLGHEVGEFGFNVPVAWAFGIPALLASGDDVLLEEVRAISSRTERCRVKESLGNKCVLCYDPQRTHHDLHTAAKRAVLNIKNAKRPSAIPGDIRITFCTKEQAMAAAAFGTMVDDTTVDFSGSDYLDSFKRAVAAMDKAARG